MIIIKFFISKNGLYIKNLKIEIINFIINVSGIVNLLDIKIIYYKIDWKLEFILVSDILVVFVR